MARYQNQVNVSMNENINKKIYTSAIPKDPIQESIEYTYIARIGDRWDTLAYKYLGSAALWYVIANANNGLNGSIFIKPGTIVTIPEQY